MSDRTIVCRDCGQSFTFTAGEQAFYQERGYSEPQRCPACRAARKAERSTSGYGDSGRGGYSSGGGSGSYSGGSRSYSSGPRQMYPATCSSCGKQTEVPFEPTAGKPVYCSDCFRAHRPQRTYDRY